MEMDSSRRPFDRSRELGLKKPRLAAEEDPSTGPFSLRPIGSAPNQVPSRYNREADRSDPGDGGGYQPQPLPPHQQHQELVEQYRTALSELTFNSKPIITNLTIIAGENLHTAKAVASTICAHIIEVPSDQKLPSLYLLDSIVKNIGRDYIKYFAAKLPEVFIRAYKQVEAPIHTSMRHLFGTWKGVFHPQMLQLIEKELGFGSSANGSSTPAASRSESQSQRPAHSIHVNPKYLERQRLQQSTRAKVIPNDMDGTLVDLPEDIERLDRPTGVTTGRTWAGLPAKRSQRDPRLDPLQDKKNIGVTYGDFEYGAEISRNSALGPGRSGAKVTEQKTWYGVSSGGAADTISTQRNGYAAKQKLQSYPQPKSSNIDSQLRSGGGMSTNWKNSEEEEFLWDSMESRSTDHDGAINSIAKKDRWTSDGSEKLDFEGNLPKALPRQGRNRIGALGTPSQSGLSDGYSATMSGLATSGGPLPRTGMGSQVRSSSYIGNPSLGISAASSGTIGQQRLQSLGPPSPSGQSPVRQHSPPVDMARHLQTDLKTSQFPGKSSLSRSRQCTDDPLQIPSDVELGSLKRLKTLEMKKVASPVISSKPGTLPKISQPTLPQVSGRQVLSSGQDSVPENSPSLLLENSRQLSASTSSLLAAIAKSGSIPISAMITSLPGLGCQDKGLEALPGDPQSTQLPFPRLKPEATVLATSRDSTSAGTNASLGKIRKGESEESPNMTKNSDPISSLLSSLVAKGLISASKADSSAPAPAPAPAPAKMAKPLLKVKREAVTAVTKPVSSASVSAKIPVSAAVDEKSTSEPVPERSDLPEPPAATEDIKNLIGFEFKPEIMRKFHSSVVDDLVAELPHQCGICGLRLKHKERLDKHLVWHESHNPEQRGRANASKWYTHSSDWVAGRTEPLPHVAEPVKVEEAESSEISAITEPMVPADESQCACILCGELFEDFYDLEKDEWMFKGAIYMNIPYGARKVDAESDSKFQGPIVHANCLSENSVQDLGLANRVKMEEDA